MHLRQKRKQILRQIGYRPLPRACMIWFRLYFHWIFLHCNLEFEIWNKGIQKYMYWLCCLTSLIKTGAKNRNLKFQVRVLYSNKMEEYPPEGEKRKLDTPEIFYVEPPKHELNQRPPLNHARAIEDARAQDRNHAHTTEDAADGGTNRKQPRVTSADSPPLKHYPRPPTYDPNNRDNSYDRLKALTFPRY